jgi:hypothetical protein
MDKFGIIFIVIALVIWKFINYEHNLTDSAQNTKGQQQVGGAAMFQVKYQTSIEEDVFGRIVTSTTYSLINTGEQSESIKWIAINNREECLAVPVWNYNKQTISAMEVLSEDSSAEVADFLSLEVGQGIPIKMPENCGEPIRIKVGTDRGEYDIGPLNFYK